MDFLHRNANGQPQAVRSNAGAGPAAAGDGPGRGKRVLDAASDPRWLRITLTILLFSLTILAIGIALLFYFGKANETHYVDNKKVQAVFLTNGQVYFGKVVKITDRYVDLQQIYYLNSQQQPENGQSTANNQQNTSFSLVKLGCELHGPVDQMIINREQVSFWENLKTEGKVSKAIDQWVAQNPNGQNCEASGTSNSTQQNTQGTGTENRQQ